MWLAQFTANRRASTDPQSSVENNFENSVETTLDSIPEVIREPPPLSQTPDLLPPPPTTLNDSSLETSVPVETNVLSNVAADVQADVQVGEADVVAGEADVQSVDAKVQEAESLKKLLQQYEQENSDLIAQLEHISQQRDDLLNTTSTEAAQSANALELLQKQLNAVVAEKSTLSDEVASLQSTLAAAKGHLSSFVQQQQDSAKERAKMVPDLSGKTDVELVQEIVSLRERMDHLMQSNSQLQEHIAEHTLESMKALALKSSDSSNQDSTDSAETVKLREEVNALKTKLTQALDKSREADQVENRLHEYAMEVNRLKKVNWDLEEQLKKRALVNLPQEEYGTNELLKIILQLTATNKQLNNRLQALRREVTGLTQSVASSGR